MTMAPANRRKRRAAAIPVLLSSGPAPVPTPYSRTPRRLQAAGDRPFSILRWMASIASRVQHRSPRPTQWPRIGLLPATVFDWGHLPRRIDRSMAVAHTRRWH